MESATTKEVPENRWLTNMMESVQIPSTNVRSSRVFLSMHYHNLIRNYSLRESLGIFKIYISTSASVQLQSTLVLQPLITPVSLVAISK